MYDHTDNHALSLSCIRHAVTNLGPQPVFLLSRCCMLSAGAWWPCPTPSGSSNRETGQQLPLMPGRRPTPPRGALLPTAQARGCHPHAADRPTAPLLCSWSGRPTTPPTGSAAQDPSRLQNNRSFSGDHGDEGAEAGAEAEAEEDQSRARAGGPPVAHIRFGFCRSGFRHMHAALARTASLLGRAQLLREWALACSLCWWAAENLLGRAKPLAALHLLWCRGVLGRA